MRKFSYTQIGQAFMLAWMCLLLLSCNGGQRKAEAVDVVVAADEYIEKLPASEDNTIIFTPQWTPQAQFAGYYVAQELGFYEERGLHVEIGHPSTTYSAIDRIRNNQSHATIMQLVQAMEIIDNGIPLVNILQTSMNNGLAIVSRDGSDPLQLKGKRVGIWAAGFDQLPICMNIKEGLEYEWVRIASNVNLFIAGDLDAITVMSYNEYYQLAQAGVELTDENVFRFCDSGYNIQEDGVYMTRDYYLNHPLQAKAFAAASKKGWEWCAAHPDEALDIVMKYVNEAHISTNRTMQRLMLNEILRLQIDQETGTQTFVLKKDMVDKASELLHEYGLLANEIAYEEIVP